MYHDLPTNVNILYTCPITYTSVAKTASTPFIWSLETGIEGSNGKYRLTLDTSLQEVPGTYEVEVIGKALGNPLSRIIKFVLILQDFCTEMGKLDLMRIPINQLVYSHYDNLSK